MDRALQNATTRREAVLVEIKSLQERLNALRSEADDIDRFMAGWHRFAGVENTATASTRMALVEKNMREVPFLEVTMRRTTGNPKKEDVAEAARSIIRERNEPVPRAELFSLLGQRGITIRGTDPEKTLSTMLWRMRDRVARVKGGGYWLQEVPYPDADYLPSDKDTESDAILGTPLDAIPDRAPEGTEARALQDELADHDRRYHVEDAPTISDADYDAKRQRLEELGY